MGATERVAASDPVPTSSSGDAMVARVIDDVIRRRAAGAVVVDEDVIAAHPDLGPALAEELRSLADMQRLYLAALKAGPLAGPLTPVAPAEMERPIRADGPRGGGVEALAFPTVVGYRFCREAGAGGQARVYKAVMESTGRTVAVKVLAGGAFARSLARARFEREADVLARLDHPNVVGILDRGRTADGSFYLAMPFVAGQPLDAWAAAKRAGDAAWAAAVLRAVAKVADGLDEAHRRGVTHRDVKPSNVLVDARDEPRLMDFGLAGLTAAAGDPGAAVDWRTHTLTGAAQVIGSVPYASPEQAAGRSATLDARGDVYSLGVCLYESLTGRLPYPTDGTLRELLDHVATTEPAPLGRLGGGGVVADPAALAAVVRRALAKDPARRHPTAAALAADLRAVLGGSPVAAETASPPPVGAAPPRPRRRWAMIAGGGVAVASLAGGIVGARHWAPIPPPPPVFELRAGSNAAGMPLVLIPAGPFMMGTAGNADVRNDDERSHPVRITRSFWIGRTEVTLGQYRLVMGGASPRGTPADADPALPVTRVSWDDAAAFCRRLGDLDGGRTYRLPTEAEWEYACRAGVGMGASGWAGNTDPDRMGWHAGNAGGGPHLPATRDANHWGLHDLHGNVAEWCLDGYNAVYPANEADPFFRDNSLAKVVRGGSFRSPAADCRSAARARVRAGERRPDLGFRVVREAGGATPATAPATRP